MKKIKNVSLMLGALAMTANSINIPINALAKESELFTKKTSEKYDAPKSKYSINWTQDIGGDKEDKFYDAIQTKDGSLVTVGQASLVPTTGFTTGDAIIVKYGVDGKELWRDVLSGDETDRYYSVVELEDGGFVALGVSYSTDLGFSNASKSGNAIITKYSNDGTKEWTKNYKDVSDPIAFKNAVSLSDGSILAVCGKIEPSIGGNAIEKDDIVTYSLVKLSKDGSVLWEKKYTEPEKQVVITDIKTSSDKKIILTGYTYNKLAKDNTSYLVAKLEEDGTEIWSTEDTIKTSTASAITEGLKGEIYVAGEITKSTKSKNVDAMLLKLDNKGGFEWSATIEGEKFDSFESVSINSKGEIIAVGHSNSKIEGTTITDKKEVIVAKYGEDGKMSDIASLGPDTQGLVVNSAVISNDDKLVLIGKQGKDPGGVPCDLINPCVQFDAVILSVEEELKAPTSCDVNAPVLSGKDITITVGDKINPMDYIELKDPTLQDLVKLIEFTTNLETDGNKYFVNKSGEYFIKYEVENECGIKDEFQIKVTAKEASCKIDAPKIEGKSEAVYYVGDKFYVFDLVKITGLDTKKIADTKVETVDGKSVLTITYESGDKAIATSNIDFEKVGTYSAEFKVINECGEANKAVKVSVKQKGVGETSPTEKPQTGDNALVYAGLAVASVVGLVLINKNNKKDENNSNEDNSNE